MRKNNLGQARGRVRDLMRLFQKKRIRNGYEGVECSRALTKDSKDLAGYRKTRVDH